MQQILKAPSSPISLIPNEILSMILLHVMRNDMPVRLKEFLRVGRNLQRVRNGVGLEESISEPSAFACSEVFFLEQLGAGQREHFLDWLLINSTCRRFRACGKKAFFSGKTFLIEPSFMKNLGGETAKGINAENLATAQACIRHVIAPARNIASPSDFVLLPRYHALQGLRSLSLDICRYDRDQGELPTLQQHPLPEEFSSSLRGIDLRVDQLQVDIKSDTDEKGHQVQTDLLIQDVCPILRTMAACKARGKVRASTGGENEH